VEVGWSALNFFTRKTMALQTHHPLRLLQLYSYGDSCKGKMKQKRKKWLSQTLDGPSKGD